MLDFEANFSNRRRLHGRAGSISLLNVPWQNKFGIGTSLARLPQRLECLKFQRAAAAQLPPMTSRHLRSENNSYLRDESLHPIAFATSSSRP